MLKKMVSAVFMVVMLCSVAYAKEYVTMVAPSGEEVSVYNTAVGEYLGMGYAISEKENESVWYMVGEGGGKLVQSYALVDGQSGAVLRRYNGAITNGKMLYYTTAADSSLYEMNLETGEERRLTTAWCNYPSELVPFMVYDGKVYVTDQYIDEVDRGYMFTYETYGGAYSYNMYTGEYRPENINIQLASNIVVEVGDGFFLAYDSKIVYFSIDDGLCVYDAMTGSKTTVSEDYFYSSGFEKGKLYFLERDIFDKVHVSCYDMNTGAKWVVRNLEMDVYDGYWDAVMTDSYVAYTSYVYEGLGVYVHYYVEDKPRLLTVSPNYAYFSTDMKNDCLYLHQSVVGDVWNIYTYKDGVLEYYGNVMSDEYYCYMYDGKYVKAVY
ncbi:MAG: hypothetical protein J1F63_09210 [Oscillospiraceae bacterium]|nr:hypothetical protein [Oscillospiraceae bacterium]